MNQAPVIAFILKGYPRISETFISKEILGLEALGFRIRIISMRHPRESFTHGHIRRIRARVDYLPSSIRPHIRLLLRHNLALAATRPVRYARALGRALGRWRRTRKSATFKHLLQAGYLVHSLVPDSGMVHFHAHFAHSPASVAHFAGILADLPFSFFAHAKDIYTQDPRQLREKIHYAAFVLTCTRYNRDYLQKVATGLSTPVDCIYHGIDLKFFRFTPPAPASPFRVLTVARHTPKKGLDLVIRAMALLRDQGMDFTHTLVGSGDLTEELKALILELDLGDRISLAGTIPHEKVIRLYAKADLFILGCRIAPDRDRDGIPNVLAESMAMGVPVVVPGVSGIPELVIHGKTGLLVPPGDPVALADAATRLLSQPKLAAAMAEAARLRVVKVFDHDRLLPELARIYRQRIKEVMK